jgi:hypothetical protein
MRVYVCELQLTPSKFLNCFSIYNDPSEYDLRSPPKNTQLLHYCVKSEFCAWTVIMMLTDVGIEAVQAVIPMSLVKEEMGQ